MTGQNPDDDARQPTDGAGRGQAGGRNGPVDRAKVLVGSQRDARLHVTAWGSDMTRARSVSSREKVRAHRERLRKEGLRPIQVWVPDVRSPAFAAEAHRQSLAVAMSPHADEDQAFIDAISIRGDE